MGAKQGWRFIEAAPAGPEETFADPCDKWFCDAAHFNHSGTRVVAALFQRTELSNGTIRPVSSHYPMAWDLANRAVAGEDRTVYYDAICSAC